MPEIPCPVAAAARSTPDALAIRSGGGNWTYGAWDDHIARTSAALHGLGVTPGSRVAIVAPNSRDYLTLLVALWRMRAIPCPINTRWPAERIGSVIACGTDAASIDRLHVSHVIADPGAELAIPFHSIEALESATPASGTTSYDTESHASVYFTSGSSGTPKAVLHRIGNHYTNAVASNANIPLSSGDCWLLSLPLYHVSGMAILWRCMIARAVIAVPDPQEDLETALVRYGVSHVSVVTTQLQRLMDTAPGVRALRGLKAILLGGSPVPLGLIDRARALRVPLCKTYGLTETASQVATTRPADPPEALYTSGKPVIDGTVRVGDDSHIFVRGATRFEGYLQGEALLQPFDAEGWFDTGDIGEWTPEGYLRVSGRSDNMFVSGGENVQPEEVERALGSIDGVDEAIVVPVSDAEFGQCAVAFVRTSRQVADLHELLRTTLPGYMIPKRFFPWPEDLINVGMKVNRARLRERAAELTAKGDPECSAPRQEAE